jgi:hypothetical protein
MGKRKVPYAFGVPKKYVDQSQGKRTGKSSESQAALVKRGQEAYKKGERLPESYFDERTDTMKKGGKVKAKALSASTRKTLAEKAKSSGISLQTLIKVYRRGQGAWVSSGSRTGTSMAAWAMGRVNSFIKGSKKHDTDLR